MRLTIQQFILYILFGLLAYQAANARGTESGGGGTTVVKDGQRILLDYLILDPTFRDQNQFQEYNQFIFSNEFLKKNKDNVFNSSLSDFRKGDYSQIAERETQKIFFNSDPFLLASSIFTEWREDNDLNAATDNALYGLFYPVSWLITDEAILGLPASIEGLKFLNLEAADLTAYYLDSQDNYLIRISSKTWNELGLISQTGLLVHEGLRHYQISSGHSGQYYFDDSILQKATSIIMLCKPRPTLSMYLNFILNNKEKVADSLPQFGPFPRVVKKYCQKRNFAGVNVR